MVWLFAFLPLKGSRAVNHLHKKGGETLLAAPSLSDMVNIAFTYILYECWIYQKNVPGYL